MTDNHPERDCPEILDALVGLGIPLAMLIVLAVLL